MHVNPQERKQVSRQYDGDAGADPRPESLLAEFA